MSANVYSSEHSMIQQQLCQLTFGWNTLDNQACDALMYVSYRASTRQTNLK